VLPKYIRKYVHGDTNKWRADITYEGNSMREVLMMNIINSEIRIRFHSYLTENVAFMHARAPIVAYIWRDVFDNTKSGWSLL